MINQFDYTKRGSTLSIHWSDATKEVCQKAHENGIAINAWIDIFEDENIGIYKQLVDNGVSFAAINPKWKNAI